VLIVHIQNVANSFRQTGPRKRLLNKLNAGIETALVYNGVARISGHKQHLHPGALGKHGVRQFPAIQVGQDNVGQKQIDVMPCIHKLQCRIAVACFQHDIAKFLKTVRGECTNVVVIFNDQNRFLSVRRRDPYRFIVVIAGRGLRARQIDLYRRSLSRFRVDLDVTSLLFDEAINLAQP
jgi:hypothetical protein